MLNYLHALLLTQLVEVPVYVPLLAFVFEVPVFTALAVSVVVNLISHPLFVFVFVPLIATTTGPLCAVVVGEVLVWLLETVLIFLRFRGCLPAIAAVSLLANSASFLAGLLLL